MSTRFTYLQLVRKRMRPADLQAYKGQQHLLGEGKPIRMMIDNGILPSMIFWGPPGTGKTTLALMLAKHFDRPFYQLSAINSGVKEVREVLDAAQKDSLFNQGKRPVLLLMRSIDLIKVSKIVFSSPLGHTTTIMLGVRLHA